MADLFADVRAFPGLTHLPGFAAEAALLDAVEMIAAAAPFRRMSTPGGKPMSVSITNCGQAGWVTDRRGYRYETKDPESGRPWPAMPALFAELAARAAADAGFPRFAPDACLINRYAPGAKMTLHRDVDERDFFQPIVSVSLACRRCFYGADQSGPINQRACPLKAGTCWSGVAQRGGISTGCCR